MIDNIYEIAKDFIVSKLTEFQLEILLIALVLVMLLTLVLIATRIKVRRLKKWVKKIEKNMQIDNVDIYSKISSLKEQVLENESLNKNASLKLSTRLNEIEELDSVYIDATNNLTKKVEEVDKKIAQLNKPKTTKATKTEDPKISTERGQNKAKVKTPSTTTKKTTKTKTSGKKISDKGD